MSNPYIPRQQVHDWVDDIDQNKGKHKQAINFLLQTQRRLSKFAATQGGKVQIGSRRTKLFIQGVVLRIFDLAGGKVAKVTDEHIRDAEKKVSAAVDQCLPLDEGFIVRMRGVEGRAQPHLLDECGVSIFDDEELDKGEMAKMFLLVWVVVEAMDAAWTPGPDFQGETEYVYTPIDE